MVQIASVNTLEAQTKAVVCEFCGGQPSGKPYYGKTLCADCIAEIDDQIDQRIDEVHEHFNDPDYEEY